MHEIMTEDSAIMYEANRGDWGRLRLYAVNRMYPWFRLYFVIVGLFSCVPAAYIGNMLWKYYERMGPVAFARIPHRFMMGYLVAALIGPFFVLMLRLLMPWIARLANTRKPDLRGVGIGRNGVSSVTAHASVTIPWWEITDIRFDRGAIYFFTHKLNAIVLPRRVHHSKTEAQTYFDRANSLWQERRRTNVDPFQYHHVAFQIEQMEFREYVLKIQKAYALTNLRGIISVLLWVSLLLLYLYARLARDFQIEIVPVWIAWTGCVALLIVSLRIDPLTCFMRKMTKQEGAMDPMEVSIDRQGIRCVTATGPEWIPWSDITKIQTSRSLIALLAAGRDPVLIPKRAFCTPATADGFLATAQAYHTGLPVTDAGSAWPPAPSAD